MVFSSITFLFFFLPITISVVWLVNFHFKGKLSIRIQNISLLVLSLVFYAWGEPVYVIVMLASILLNYHIGRLLGNEKYASSHKFIITIGVVLNLFSLALLKYLAYLTDLLNIVLRLLSIPEVTAATIPLPVGISFFTFQALSYIFDVYKGETKAQKNILDLGLYISLFPQLIAGPIVRYHDIANQLVSRVMTMNGVAAGFRRFVIGFGKKVLIANTMARVADEIFGMANNEITTPLAWIGVIAYTFQIYFDFSGYSDMAIGLGRVFGFKFLENFNYPYVAQSIQEFWRRWHMSLSRWFRDYLYIPLGGSRGSAFSTYRNQFIVFALCGLWHGASTNFLFWGIYHGVFLSIEKLGLLKVLDRLGRIPRHIYTMLVVMIGWVFFRAESFGQSTQFLSSMFGFAPISSSYHWKFIDDREFMLALLFALIGSSRFFLDKLINVDLGSKEKSITKTIVRTAKNPVFVSLVMVAIIVTTTLSIMPDGGVYTHKDRIVLSAESPGISLSKTPVVTNYEVEPGDSLLSVSGELTIQEGTQDKRALVALKFVDEAGNELAPPEEIAISKAVGAYIYLPTLKSGPFILTFRIPENTKHVMLLFQGWYNQNKVVLGSNLEIKVNRLSKEGDNNALLAGLGQSFMLLAMVGVPLTFLALAIRRQATDGSWHLIFLRDIYILIVFLISAWYMSSGAYNPFIYYRF